MKNNNFLQIAFILISFVIFNEKIYSEIERYQLMQLNGVDVYFPKDNKTYINDIINSGHIDKFLYLSGIYWDLKEEELAFYYFDNYKGNNWELKKKIANKLGKDFFTKEFEKIEFVEEKEYKNYFAINSVDSLHQYLNYFSLKEGKEKNIYERLFKYKYENKTEEFNQLYEELSKSAKDKNIIEENFVLQLLKKQYEEAKKIAFIKPQLFMDLIYFMNIDKAEKSLIKDFITQFKLQFNGVYEKDILIFEVKYLLNENEKITVLETYLKKSFDEEVFEEYFRISKNIDFLKRYLEDLVFEKAHEKYINYLVSLDKTYESKIYLTKLFDKSYLFKYLEKNSEPIEEIYKTEYISYLFEAKNYKKLFEYKEQLNYQMLKELKINGFSVDTLIKQKYPLELEFADLNTLKYFYFNKSPLFDEVLIKDLERQKQLNPVEIYYLSRYYKKMGNNEKFLELQYGLKDNYMLEEK